jgi:hypothetical protein
MFKLLFDLSSDIIFALVLKNSIMATSKKKTGRAKPVAAKAGFSRDPKRRYNDGGKLYCKGGKLK